jgi:hypothetical protein
VVQGGVLVGAERLESGSRSAVGHGSKLLPGDETAALAQWDQLADLVAVAGDRERLAVLDGSAALKIAKPRCSSSEDIIGIQFWTGILV